MEKNSALLLGMTASLGVGYFLGRRDAQSTRKFRSKYVNDVEQDEIDRLIRKNILKLSPYRCARDDYDEGIIIELIFTITIL